MSVPALFWATQQDAPAMQKIVLVMIANRLNKDTGDCFPSLDTLAKDTGMSRRTVINKIAQLEAAGLLFVKRSYNEHVKQNNNYQLCTPSAHAPHAPVVNTTHGGSEPTAPVVVNEMHLKQVIKTNNLTTTTQPHTSGIPSATQIKTQSKNKLEPVQRGSGDFSEQRKSTSEPTANSDKTDVSNDKHALLVFPKTFSDQEIKTTLNLLHSVAIDDQQPVLDVLISAVEGDQIRKSAIACLSGLVKRYREGTFDPSTGDNVRLRRKQRVLNQKRVANTETIDHDQVMAQLAALQKSIPHPTPTKQHPSRSSPLGPIRPQIPLR